MEPQAAGAETTTPEGWEAFEQRLREQPPAPEAVPEVPTGFQEQLSATPVNPPPSLPGMPAEGSGASGGGDFGATVLLQSPVTETAPPATTPPTTPPSVVPPGAPPAAAKPPSGGAKPPVNRTLIWIAAAAVLVLIIAWFVASSFRPVLVVIRTHPQGATIRVNGEVKGSGEVQLKLRAGIYQVDAQKDGYQPATQALVVKRGSPAELDLTLQAPPPVIPPVPVAQVLRVTSDFQTGKVKFDDEAATDLQDGQFANEALGLGKHTLEITSGSSKTNIGFEAAAGRMPVLTETPTAKEVKAVVLTSFQNQAHIQATYAPVKVSVDNQDYGEAGANGIDIPNLPAGKP